MISSFFQASATLSRKMSGIRVQIASTQGGKKIVSPLGLELLYLNMECQALTYQATEVLIGAAHACVASVFFNKKRNR